QFLGQTTVSTDSLGNVAFSFATTTTLVGSIITATATDPSGNSSVFSKSFQLAAFVVTHTNDSRPGSSRQVITDANATLGGQTITFNIPGTGPFTITPLSALPVVTDPVIIDATTQPGFSGKPFVEINGSSAGVNVDGLTVNAGNSTVRGLAINRF